MFPTSYGIRRRRSSTTSNTSSDNANTNNAPQSFSRRRTSSSNNLDSSITSGIEALEMSYSGNNNNSKSIKSKNTMNYVGAGEEGEGEELTPQEQEEVSKLPKSTWSVFVSPAERKRRQREKQAQQEAMAAAQQQKQAQQEAQQAPQEAPQLIQRPSPFIPPTDEVRPLAPPAMAKPPTAEEVRSESSSESLTEEEKQTAAAIAKTSFVSPAERKRRMLARRRASMEEEEQKQQQEGGVGVEGESSSDKQVLRSAVAALTRQKSASSPAGSSMSSSSAAAASSNQSHLDELASAFASHDPSGAGDAPTAQDPSAAAEGEDPETSSVPTAIPPPPSGGNTEQLKRSAIQKVMGNKELTPQERMAAIQKIIKGDFDQTGTGGQQEKKGQGTVGEKGQGAAAGKGEEVPLMDSSSESGSSEEEEEESSSDEEESSSGEEESSEEELEEGEEWLSSSSYETDSAVSGAVAKEGGGGGAGGGDQTTNEERNVLAASTKSELPDSASESSSYRNPKRGSMGGESELTPNNNDDGAQDDDVHADHAAAIAAASQRVRNLEEQLDRELSTTLSNHSLDDEQREQLKSDLKARQAELEKMQHQVRLKHGLVEAQLDKVLANHNAELEQKESEQVQKELQAQTLADKERQAILEAQLDTELKNHAELEREQQQRELEFQKKAAAEEERLHLMAMKEKERKERLLALEKERHAAMEREQKEQELEFQESTNKEEMEEMRAVSSSNVPQQQSKDEHKERLQSLEKETQRLRLIREEHEREEAQRRLQEEREREEDRIRALREETERETRRIQALRQERERQEREHRVQEEQRLLREESEREKLRMRQERELEEQRLRALQEERERQAALREEREREARRLQEERALEESRLRALQEERERRERLAQEEQQRRLQAEQLRLQEEREREERRLREQRELHQRLERERIQRSREQEEQRDLFQLQHQQEQQEIQVTRAIAPAQQPRSANRGVPSLRASQTLATRQGDFGSSNTPAATAASRSTPYTSSLQPQSGSQQRPLRYDGVDDDELNWRLDSYASLSDFTIVVHRAHPGPYAPDFDTSDVSGIQFVMNDGPNSSSPKRDVYYVHKAMIAVGSRRSELLGRRIREAENASRGDRTPDGHSSEVNVHETVMLESAANAWGIMLDFLYYPDRPLDINVENAVPLVYLGKRYKIRALLEQAELYVMENIESATAMYFLLDSYLYKLEEILGRAIDVTAANLAETADFDPIYKLPPELFRRIILSKELNCDSELLSLIVYSYCGEHHAEDIDVEYFRELTKPRIMPDIDPKVALMVLKFYVDLILDDDENCNIMEVLQGDSLMSRCVTVVAKHWQGEVCEPMMIDDEWANNPTPSLRRTPAASHEPATLHRLLPHELQSYLLEKCILEAKNDVDSEKTVVQNFEGKKKEEMENNAKSFGQIVKELQAELKRSKEAKGREGTEYLNQINLLQQKTAELEEQLDQKNKALEEYKQELRHFRRVPGIHNFGRVSSDDPKIIDKTLCTYSANPDHHYPNHRRGSRRPTQMPNKGKELENLAKENGYVYDDGKGGLLPVYYYHKRTGGGAGVSLEL